MRSLDLPAVDGHGVVLRARTGAHQGCSPLPDGTSARPSLQRTSPPPRPAGHSSWAASGLGYTSQFLLCRLRPFEGSGQPWRLAAAAAPAAGAVLIGISRVVDYWHHWTDVVAGLSLGFAVAWACYRQQGARLAELDAQEGRAGAAGRQSDPAGESLLRAGANGSSRSALLPL